jgi:hypothetical protein
MIPEVSEDYKRKVEEAMLDALFRASIVGEGENRTATFYPGEIVSACLSILAFAAGTSEAVSSPTKLRNFGDECGKRIRSKILEVQRRHAAGEMDGFMTVVRAKDRS